MKKIMLLGLMASVCLSVTVQDDTYISTQKPDSCYLVVGESKIA